MLDPRTLLLGPLLAVPACGGPSSLEGGLEAPHSAARLYAMQQTARTGDPSAVRHLVEQLESDDAAVRAVAIRTLERLTGQTLGFDPADPPAARREAVRRWVQAVESGEITANPGPNPADERGRETTP